MATSTFRIFTDPDEHSRSIRAAHAEFVLTKAGEYRADLTRIELPRVWIQANHTSLPHIARYGLVTDRACFFFLDEAQRGPIQHSGMEFFPGEIMSESIGSEHYHCVAGGSHWKSMSLAPKDLAAAGRAIAGVDLRAPVGNQRLRPPPELFMRLSRLHDAATKLAATVPDVLAHPEVARAIEQELLRAAVGCIVAGSPAESKGQLGQRASVMRRFERVLEENEGGALYVAEICEAVGVSERTLRTYCMKNLGVNPHRYLWLRRMKLARRALTLADRAADTVTEVATAYGFWELGRFAVAYGELFGEAPSTTLRRERAHHPAAP